MTNTRSDSAFAFRSACKRSQDGSHSAPPGSAGHGQSLPPQGYEAAAFHPLDEEIARAEEAYQLMLVADTCLRSGADRLLLALGFSQAHIDDLHARSGPGWRLSAIRPAHDSTDSSHVGAGPSRRLRCGSLNQTLL